MGYYWELLIDPSTLILTMVVITTIIIGANRSVTFRNSLRKRKDTIEEGAEDNPEDAHVLKWGTAILMPIMGSIMLIILFYFLKWLTYLLIGLFGISSFFAVAFVLAPVLAYVIDKLGLPQECRLRIRICSEDRWSIPWLAALPLALTAVLLWLFVRHWLLTDVLALCLGITALAVLQLPNLKISCLILWMFFFYDIFWVFVSKFIFGDNVMVHVATSLPSLPILILIPRLLFSGYSLLGMGDIILPGLYLAFLHRFDIERGPTKWFGLAGFYFRLGLVSYVFGFILTYIMLIALQMAQPALLYLVPCIMLPTIFMGYMRGDLSLLWHGPPTETDDGVVGSGEARHPGEDVELGTLAQATYKRLPTETIEGADATTLCEADPHQFGTDGADDPAPAHLPPLDSRESAKDKPPLPNPFEEASDS
jgi:MFS family permease